MGKIWVVGHRYKFRRWCDVRVRQAHSTTWQRGFVWAEWNAPISTSPIAPRIPSLQSAPMSNVDPLVFGPRMYFDYCKKGRKKTLTNLKEPNALGPGDLVLFACAFRGSIWVDTVFAIGAAKPWPSAPSSLPAWDSIDTIAARVHFHEHALHQHPEVRDRRVRAMSYRSASDQDGGARFAWVPWSRSHSSPMELTSTSKAHRVLQDIYPGKCLADGFTGSFAVARAQESTVQELFDQLMDLAVRQGFGIASELAFLDAIEVTYETVADGPC